MLKFSFNGNLRALEKAIKEEEARMKRDAKQRVTEIGERAVKVAKESTSYRDVTGRLRSSNGYRVDEDLTLTLYNDCPYAAEKSANGADVLDSAILFADKELKRTFE